MSSYNPILGDLGAIFQAKFPPKFVFVFVENWHFQDKATNPACVCVFFFSSWIIFFNLKWLFLTAGAFFFVLNYTEHAFGVHKYWKTNYKNAG